MFRKLMCRIAPALLLLVCAPARAGEAPPPEEFVRSEIGAMADLLTGGKADRYDVLRNRIRGLADFDGFARKSLGKNWAALSPEDQKRFKDTIQNLLESYYMSKPGSIFDKKKAVVQGAKLSGDTADVTLTVKRKDVDVAIGVKLRKEGSAWIADDVAIDGLSLLDDYRAQFRDFLKKKTVPELMDRLNARAKAQYEKH